MATSREDSGFSTHAVFAVVAAVCVELARQTSHILPHPLKNTLGFLLCLVGFLLPVLLAYLSRWSTARPDEWQLLIRGGRLVDAGVGATHFRNFFDNVQRFPSSIQKVTFKVEQVTSEMQGVVVSGFALWSVHREGDGPWRAYKNLVLRDVDGDGKLDSENGNNHIRDTVQSIIRVAVAQQTLNNCLTRRDEIRSTVRDQIMKQLQGWGVWLETVEISDVRVASNSLFCDLQAEFRAAQRLTAERVRLTTERQLLHEKLQADLEETRRRTEAEANKAIAAAEQKLRQERKGAELLEATKEVQGKRLALEREMALAQVESDHAVEMLRARCEAEAAATRASGEVTAEKMRDERLGSVSDRQLDIMRVEAAREIYSRVGDIRISQFGGVAGASDGAGEQGAVAGLMPGLAALASSWEVVRQSSA